MSRNLNAAVTGTSTNEEAKRLLLAAGVSALQRQSAFLPLETDEALLETEQSFSERTRASRQTRYIRLHKWINWQWAQWGKGYFLPEGAWLQIQYIAYEQYKEGE